VRQGITPLPVDGAIEHLQSMLDWKQSPASAIVTGRFGGLSTLKFDSPELPLMRFLEHPRLYHPGIELIVDAELSADTDPYVTEHAFQGEQLLPAVMGMEAMAQAAQALEQTPLLPCFRSLRFEHPIVIPRDKPVTIRVATLRRQPGTVSAVVRCSSTGFQVDHFSGECIFEKNQFAPDHSAASTSAPSVIRLDSAHNLYGRILFHRGRFCRVEAYELLHSDRSIAKLSAPAEAPWFARHLPSALVMGDAASRDAALHSIQACIPHKTILPVGIDRITLGSAWTHAAARVHARERNCDGDSFVYDVRIEDAEGRLCEEWEGLHLRAVATIEVTEPWPLGLLVPYLERKVRQILAPCEIKVGITRATEERCECAIGNLVQEIFGPAATLVHRPDGKPEIAGATSPHPCVSISHSGETTLLFAAGRAAGCDVEKIVCRDPEAWERLLGTEGLALAKALVGASKASFDDAAMQVWTLQESLRKAGASFAQPMCLSSCSPDGWASFSAGVFKAATFRTQIEEAKSAFAFGFVINNTP
jgi:enediyne polyketide synthase